MNELKSWDEEKSSAHLYRVVAAQETGTARQDCFLNWHAKRRSSRIWEQKIREAGGVVPRFSPTCVPASSPHW
jgi:hypothetical protein